MKNIFGIFLFCCIAFSSYALSPVTIIVQNTGKSDWNGTYAIGQQWVWSCGGQIGNRGDDGHSTVSGSLLSGATLTISAVCELDGHPTGCNWQYAQYNVTTWDSHGNPYTSAWSANTYAGQTIYLTVQVGDPLPPPPPKANNTNDVPQCDTNSCGCRGMPMWRVSEPYISLWLEDEPLGYQPAIGSRVSFTLSYNQRETGSGYNPNLFSVGKRWYCSWLSYLTQDSSGNKTVYLSDGGAQVFNTTSNYLTSTILTGSTSTGFTLLYPDGSKDIYGFIVTNTDGTFESAFMSQQVNAQGQTTIFNYSPYTPGPTPVIQLSSVVDGDGRTSRVFYNSTSMFSQNLISAVVDPFNRTNFLTYDNNGELTNSIDVAGMSSSFGYDQNGWVTNLITPYGTNSFAITDGTNSAYPNGRSILVTRPDSSHELYLYEDYAHGAASAYTPPSTAPFQNTFNVSDLDSRNSYHWGPRQYAALSTATISSFTAADFLKARMRHWLLDSSGSVGSTLSLERDPSPDSGGTIEGQKTWYDYAGKTNLEYEGFQFSPLFVARTLPDGSASFVKTDRNPVVP